MALVASKRAECGEMGRTSKSSAQNSPQKAIKSLSRYDAMAASSSSVAALDWKGAVAVEVV